MRGPLSAATALALALAMGACSQFPGQVASGVGPAVMVGATEMAMQLPADQGALSVAIALAESADAAQRRVFSAVQLSEFFKDIDHIDFTIEVEALPEPIKASVKRTQFLNNQAVLQINNLPPGKIAIRASAQKADGTVVVTANGEGAVVPNQVTGIHLTCVPRFEAGSGHVRIEMDCWTTCGCGDHAPTPAPSAFVPDPLTIVNFKSIQDPHEEGGNGVKFDNNRVGTFLALKTLTGDFVLEKTQDAVPGGTKWPDKTVNNAVDVKSDGDVFAYYVYGTRAKLNGKTIALESGKTVTAPHGMTITRTGATIALATPEGDAVAIVDKGFYLDVAGTVSGRRVVHEVTGSLGSYNNGSTADAFKLRSGAVTKDMQAFLIDWMVKPAEDLFPLDEPFIPEGYVYAPASPKPAASPDPATPKPAASPSTAAS
jgi:hypothetical protein